MVDLRQYAPATERNRQSILEVLQRVLPSEGTVLEISSGTGEHITFFAEQMPLLQWLPSEPQPEGRQSIQSWGEASLATNLLLPLDLDVSVSPWPVEANAFSSEISLKAPITAIVNINMIHIAPWEMCDRLMSGAKRVLPVGGVLYMYGPYQRAGKHTAPSNEAFDRMLQDRDPNWGIRDLETVIEIAQRHGLALAEIVEMPANNLSVIYKRER